MIHKFRRSFKEVLWYRAVSCVALGWHYSFPGKSNKLFELKTFLNSNLGGFESTISENRKVVHYQLALVDKGLIH